MAPGRQLALLWGAAAVGLVALAPWGGKLAAGLPACPVLTLLGFPCVSCGTTRAALALSRLDVLSALALNPLAAVAWMSVVGGGLGFGVAGLLGGSVPGLDWRPPLAVRLGAVLALVGNWLWVLRSAA